MPRVRNPNRQFAKELRRLGKQITKDVTAAQLKQWSDVVQEVRAVTGANRHTCNMLLAIPRYNPAADLGMLTVDLLALASRVAVEVESQPKSRLYIVDWPIREWVREVRQGSR